MLDHELIKKIILYIGAVENERPYFTPDEIEIEGYDAQTIKDHVAALIEGEIIDGFFAFHESSDRYGYLVGGLTLESRYLYRQLKEAQ